MQPTSTTGKFRNIKTTTNAISNSPGQFVTIMAEAEFDDGQWRDIEDHSPVMAATEAHRLAAAVQAAEAPMAYWSACHRRWNA
jgi:hypothetical protein